MFKVFLDGVFHSTHSTYVEACRNARIQASRYKNSYFTVFEAPAGMDNVATDSDTLCGLPQYIITPNDAVSNGAISLTNSSSLLRMRLPSTQIMTLNEHPLI